MRGKSSSTKKPIKTLFKDGELEMFNKAKTYQQWEFRSGCE